MIDDDKFAWLNNDCQEGEVCRGLTDTPTAEGWTWKTKRVGVKQWNLVTKQFVWPVYVQTSELLKVYPNVEIKDLRTPIKLKGEHND